MVAGLWRLTVVALIVGAVGLAPPAPAFACTQPPGGLPYYSVADHVKAAPIVLEGVVIATQLPALTPQLQRAPLRRRLRRLLR